MGSHSETNTISFADARTAGDAMEHAVRKWYDGEYYSRSHNASPASSPQHPMMTREAASVGLWDYEAMPVNSGQSVIIPICSAADTVTKTTKRRLTVTAAELAKLRGGAHSILDRARAEFGPTVVKVDVIALPKPRMAVAAATDGKAVTRYAVAHADQYNSQGYMTSEGRTIGEPYTSQSDARAAAINLVNANPQVASLVVRAVIVRESGNTNLVTISRPEPDTSQITLDVTTSEVKPGAKQSDWLVSFNVHT